MIIDDALIHSRKNLTRRQWERIASAHRRAESFVFGKSASALAGRFAAECGELILRHRQFAIAPFPDTYVEVDSREFCAGFRNRKLSSMDRQLGFTDENADHTVGYLITGDHVFVCASGSSGSAQITPIYYTIAPPGGQARFDNSSWGRPIALAADADGEWNKLVYGLGTIIPNIHDEDERQSLLREFQIHYLDGRTSEQAALAAYGGAGEIGNLWACLLWLNRPEHTVFSNQPAGRRFIGGKQVAYKAHRIVEIDLHRMRSIRRAFTLSGPRLSPRRHNVRGTFHHSGGEIACSHDWPLLPDVDGHWQCRRCGRLRWWVKDHVRGDATRGWVSHEYAVHT
jgi:hypothetical protein